MLIALEKRVQIWTGTGDRHTDKTSTMMGFQNLHTTLKIHKVKPWPKGDAVSLCKQQASVTKYAI
jgi:hypothetical protein